MIVILIFSFIIIITRWKTRKPDLLLSKKLKRTFALASQTVELACTRAASLIMIMMMMSMIMIMMIIMKTIMMMMMMMILDLSFTLEATLNVFLKMTMMIAKMAKMTMAIIWWWKPEFYIGIRTQHVPQERVLSVSHEAPSRSGRISPGWLPLS